MTSIPACSYVTFTRDQFHSYLSRGSDDDKRLKLIRSSALICERMGGTFKRDLFDANVPIEEVSLQYCLQLRMKLEEAAITSNILELSKKNNFWLLLKLSNNKYYYSIRLLLKEDVNNRNVISELAKKLMHILGHLKTEYIGNKYTAVCRVGENNRVSGTTRLAVSIAVLYQWEVGKNPRDWNKYYVSLPCKRKNCRYCNVIEDDASDDDISSVKEFVNRASPEMLPLFKLLRTRTVSSVTMRKTGPVRCLVQVDSKKRGGNQYMRVPLLLNKQFPEDSSKMCLEVSKAVI